MPTTYDQVYQKFASKIEDQDLFNMLTFDLIAILTGYLDTACTYFTKCLQDLSQRNDDTQEFLITLTPFEIEILACVMASTWVQPKINKITLLKQTLNDGDFKTFSQANHLKELQILRNDLESEYHRLMVQYTYDFGTDGVWDNLGSNAVRRV